jgi:predicted methyltransferase
VSPDLGLSTTQVSLSSEGVLFPDGKQLDWKSIDQIAGSENKCYVIRDQEVSEIKLFSNYTNRVYSLYPTSGAPTMLISGIPMHRIKDTDPHQDTLQKIKAITPVVGRVLDTATGLGYTAIEAAKYAEQVVTIELDPVALEIARLNPWSRELFGNPRISQIIGDSFEELRTLDSSSFSRIIHDPPAFSLAGDLYSETFYRELFRVLRERGRLFHYIGDPESKSGHNTTIGVVRRLRQAGFTRIFPEPRAFGVVAIK